MKNLPVARDYDGWIRSIKARVQRARLKALMMANAEQILLYWDVGKEILSKQDIEGWGSKIVDRMSSDLKAAFPDMKGWSPRNLKYMRAFADAWERKAIVQAPLAQLPWYHHLALLKSRIRNSISARFQMFGKTLGVVLCRSRNDIVAEYALADLDKPIGVSTYQLGLPPPEQLQAKLAALLQAPKKKGVRHA